MGLRGWGFVEMPPPPYYYKEEEDERGQQRSRHGRGRGQQVMKFRRGR